jgi:hypothetical protein
LRVFIKKKSRNILTFVSTCKEPTLWQRGMFVSPRLEQWRSCVFLGCRGWRGAVRGRGVCGGWMRGGGWVRGGVRGGVCGCAVAGVGGRVRAGVGGCGWVWVGVGGCGRSCAGVRGCAWVCVGVRYAERSLSRCPQTGRDVPTDPLAGAQDTKTSSVRWPARSRKAAI